MFDTLFQSFISYYPQLAGTAIIVFVVALVTWKISRFYFKINKVSDLERKVEGIEPLLVKISSGLTMLNQILVEKNIISRSCYSQENSPRVLNDLGKRLFEQSGASVVYSLMKNELIEDVNKKQFDSLLELEFVCVNSFLEKMNDLRFKDIQNFAFQHPTFEGTALSFTDILFVMALKLRDDFRASYPEKQLG